MSKPHISTIDINNFISIKGSKDYLLKENNDLKRLSQMQNQKINLRQLVLDYILNKCFKNKEKHKTPSNSQNQTLKKLLVSFQIQLNGKQITIQSNGYKVIEKFIDEEKKSLFNQNNLESLVSQTLIFFEQIEQIAQTIQFDLNPDQQQISDKVIEIVIKHHLSQNQRLSRLKDLDILKSDSKQIKKFIKLEQSTQQSVLSYRVNRDTLSTINDKDSQLSSFDQKSKLKDLVDNYSVFQHPQKVQKLRKQKIRELYDGIDIDGAIQKSRVQFNGLKENKNLMRDSEELKFLQGWIMEIDVSEKLFLKKLQGKNIKSKQNQVKVGRIMQESQDEDERQPDPKQSGKLK